MENDVRERRQARSLSQAELAEALGVSRQTINSIETGRYVPSLPLALGLARFFETTVEEMFDGTLTRTAWFLPLFSLRSGSRSSRRSGSAASPGMASTRCS